MKPGNELVWLNLILVQTLLCRGSTWRDQGREATLFWTRSQISEEGSERSLRYWSELGMQHKRIGL